MFTNRGINSGTWDDVQCSYGGDKALCDFQSRKHGILMNGRVTTQAFKFIQDSYDLYPQLGPLTLVLPYL